MIILFILLVLLGPRFAGAMWWLLSPARFNLAFPNIIFGILGLVFLPWTTLMYIIVFPGGIAGWDWLWIGISFFADLSSYGGSAFGGKKQMSSPKTSAPSTPAQ